MLKALFKKQFLELGNAYKIKGSGRKKDSADSSKGMRSTFVMLAAVFLLLAASFYAMADMLASALLPTPMSWMYFTIIGSLALLLGVFGSVFNAQSSLYRAKDNDLLLSMPIAPSKILLVRMTGVFVTGLLFEAMVFLPAVIAFWLHTTPGPLEVVCPLVLFLMLGLLALVLSCLIGWLVALIAGKLKNKSFVTLAVSLVFFGAYFYFCMNSSGILSELMANSQVYGEGIKGSAYPLYLMGIAGEGNLLALLALSAAVVILFALTCFVMSKTFLHIATKSDSTKKVEYHEKEAKKGSCRRALFFKEWKRFTSSSTYMLNCGMGTVFMIVCIGALLIFRGGEEISNLLIIFDALPNSYSVLVAMAVPCMVVSMNDITAPSISMEGCNVWIAQSMPIEAGQVLDAKQQVQWVITLPLALILTVILCVMLKVGIVESVLVAAIVVLFAMLCSAVGLVLNLRNHDLNWTNESVPVKQSGSVMITLFGAMILAIALAAAAFFALDYVDILVVLAGLLVLLGLAVLLLNRWLHTKGAQMFYEL